MDKQKAMGFECKQCGNCCIDVGRTFWKNGNFEGIPELNRRAKSGESEDGGKPCEMLKLKDGLAVCLIQQKYGYVYKPTVCREHQGDMRCAYKHKALTVAKAALEYVLGMCGSPPKSGDCEEAIGVLKALSGEAMDTYGTSGEG